MMRLPAMSVAVAVALFVPALGVSATPMVLSPSLVAQPRFGPRFTGS